MKFHEISFDELTNEELSSYDAVIMTEENLPKAAEAKYADTYSDSSIPVFFISATVISRLLLKTQNIMIHGNGKPVKAMMWEFLNPKKIIHFIVGGMGCIMTK